MTKLDWSLHKGIRNKRCSSSKKMCKMGYDKSCIILKCATRVEAISYFRKSQYNTNGQSVA
jgi:hypothetical protein